MPLYRVEHVCSLTSSQQDELAKLLTETQSEKFTMPSLFANRTTNCLLVHIRTGPSRTMKYCHSLTASVNQAWCSIVGSSGDKELRAFFILGDVLTGFEVGLPISAAEEETTWLTKYYGEFEKKAREGDEEFVGLPKDIDERKELKGAVERA